MSMTEEKNNNFSEKFHKVTEGGVKVAQKVKNGLKVAAHMAHVVSKEKVVPMATGMIVGWAVAFGEALSLAECMLLDKGNPLINLGIAAAGAPAFFAGFYLAQRKDWGDFQLKAIGGKKLTQKVKEILKSPVTGHAKVIAGSVMTAVGAFTANAALAVAGAAITASSFVNFGIASFVQKKAGRSS